MFSKPLSFLPLSRKNGDQSSKIHMKNLHFWALAALLSHAAGTNPADSSTPATPPPTCNCTISRGNFTAPLPFLYANQTASAFYSYGNPAGASANTGIEEPNAMLVMLYEDLNTGNTSLITILDQAGDPDGGNVTLEINCLPDSAYVDVSDDFNELSGTPPTITGNFNWAPCCTDGGVIGGVGCGNTITINPTINSGISNFYFVYGDAAAPTYVILPASNCPIIINCGGSSCCEQTINAEAYQQNPSCPQSPDGSIDLVIPDQCVPNPSFLWSTGATTEDLSNLLPGNYSVTITDAANCTEVLNFNLIADANYPTPSISGPQGICPGQIAQLTLNQSYASYSWSTEQNSSSILVSSPGTYSVTVTNSGGCSGTASIEIVAYPPAIPSISGPTEICEGDTVLLDAGPGFANYQWSTGQSGQTIEVTEAGGYVVTTTNASGCQGFDFVILNSLQTDTTNLFLQTCDPQQAGTFTQVLSNQNGCDSIVISYVTLSSSDTTNLFLQTCDPQQAGTFTQILSNQNGCDSIVISYVTLLQTDTTFVFEQTCLSSDTGLVVQHLTNQYGCDSLIWIQTSLSAPEDCQLHAEVWGDTLGCQADQGSLHFLLEMGTPPFIWSWQKANSILNDSGSFNQTGQFLLPQLLPGLYAVQLSDANGLIFSDSIWIFKVDDISFHLQSSMDYHGFDVSCYGSADGLVYVEGLIGGLPPYQFTWSNSPSSDASFVSDVPAGWLIVSVQGSLGCTTTDSIYLSQPDSLSFVLQLNDPSCFTEGLGRIQATSLSGGVPPYSFSIDDGPWQISPSFDQLSSGQHELQVRDENGCTASALGYIDAYLPLTIDLGQDTLIDFGDSILLSPVVNISFDLLDSLYWEAVDCPNCFELVVVPLASSSYSVVVFDSLGCSAEDKINVYVKKDFKIFAPTAFSPNGDGVNDAFTIYGGRALERINTLQVFSRWGEPLFQAYDIPPNEPVLGWDGTYRGQLMNPGVFSWFAVLQFSDGGTKIIKGDLHLIR